MLYLTLSLTLASAEPLEPPQDVEVVTPAPPATLEEIEQTWRLQLKREFSRLVKLFVD